MNDDCMNDEEVNDSEMNEMRQEYDYLTSIEGYEDYLYKNHPIGNGSMLVSLLEDTAIQAAYFKENGLSADTEIRS